MGPVDDRFTALRLLRLGVLLALLSGAAMLFRWSRTADPRFYRFLRTAPGRVLARALRWDLPWRRGPDEKPESEMLPDERAVKQHLEEACAAAAPRERLVLDTGQALVGRLVEEHEDYVVFEEAYGQSGALSAKIRRDRIRALEPIREPLPSISYRDVRFQMEFPDLKLYRRPPYTIVTDESYFHVERSVRVLQELHEEFLRTFGPLVSRPRPAADIQVLFFSDEASFERYRRALAPGMAGARGFYSLGLDRLIVFNEKRAGYAADWTEEESPQPGAGSGGSATEEAARRRRQLRRELEHEAEQRTFVTLRHEGAHQLFYTYGIHSQDRVENEWLIEGLATFCETRPIGEKDPPRVALLKRRLASGELMPLADLIKFRHVHGFMALGDPGRVEAAYAQAWALVRYLMEPARRNSFFEYIRYLRDPQRFYAVLGQDTAELLGRFLGCTPDQLEADWTAYVRRL